MNRRWYFLLLPVLLWAAGCKRSTPESRPDFELNVRLAGEPDRLHPMLAGTGYATDVLRLTHFPLLEFHPENLTLEPLLAVSLPEVVRLDTGVYAGGQAFIYEIRPEARWDDGMPVTAADYIFTLKAAFHPLVKATAWRGALSFIKDVQPDPANPRRFTVFTADDYFLALPATGNFNLYPRHIYDPEGWLDGVSLSELSDPERADALAAADPAMLAFAAAFGSDAMSRDTALVRGAGPYRLAEWVSGEYLVLERKENWWGFELTGQSEQFEALPARIRFKFVPDEQAALAMLRDGSLDVMGGVSPATWDALTQAQDTLLQQVLPVFMQYVFISLNNRNPKLADVPTRKALAHLLDMDEVLRTVLLGLGERMTGPFHPSRPYTDQSLKPVPFDPAKARRLLAEAGWADSNGNGTVDRLIDGRRVELELTLLLRPGSEVGQQIGLLFQQGARQAGVGIKVETRDFKLIMEDMSRRDYDMSLLSLRQAPADDDPYQAWHSDADRPDGSNRQGYRSARADSLIEAIRQAPAQETRYRLYGALHRQIYEDQPVLFLYAPREPVLARRAVKGLRPSPLRPGYYPPFLYL